MWDGKQMDMMEKISRHEKAEYERESALIREKLESLYTDTKAHFGYLDRDLPDGLVVIVSMVARTQKSDDYRVRRFRTVVGHHFGVSGDMIHLISCPNEEWPEEPVWQPFHGCRWIYPEGQLWTRKEPEFEPDIQWGGGCAKCYENCDECGKVTGPYPRTEMDSV